MIIYVCFFYLTSRHRPVLEKCYDIDHVMKVGHCPSTSLTSVVRCLVYKSTVSHTFDKVHFWMLPCCRMNVHVNARLHLTWHDLASLSLQAKTIREFDTRFTSKMFGYPTNDDYYRDASPVHRLKSVQVPMLCLNAADDVFSPCHGESSGLVLIQARMCFCQCKTPYYAVWLVCVVCGDPYEHVAALLTAWCGSQPFQWRRWSRTPTLPSSSPVVAAILAFWKASGPDRALTWTVFSSSLPRLS